MTPVLVAVMGPTASGKTALAEALADTLGAQLVNSDSFQVYRGMDIGTAKTSRKTDYKLLDIKDPDESYGVGEFVVRACQELARLHHEERNAVLVGGTGLNVRALFEGYQDLHQAPPEALREELNRIFASEGLEPLVQRLGQIPSALETVDLRNPMRVIRAIEKAESGTGTIEIGLPPFAKLKIGLLPDPGILPAVISRRVDEMVQNGWVQEVAELRRRGYGQSDPGMRAHGYRAMLRHLEGEIGLPEAMAIAVSDTWRYAKRQRTWLRKEPDLHVLRDAEESHLEQSMELIRSRLR